MKRIREFLESIVFAGMKPGDQAVPKRNLRWLGPLRDSIERFVSSPAPTDPLYLTNRTPTQKLKSWGLIAIPCLVLAVGIAVTLSNVIDPPDAKRVPEAPPGQVTAKVLPNMAAKDLKLTSPDVQVLEVHVEGSRLVGAVRNTTAREIAAAELVFALTDSAGSQVGDVTGTVEKLAPSSSKEFEIPIKQHDAAFALVREVKSR
jgi:hypothetical protein